VSSLFYGDGTRRHGGMSVSGMCRADGTGGQLHSHTRSTASDYDDSDEHRGVFLDPDNHQNIALSYRHAVQ